MNLGVAECEEQLFTACNRAVIWVSLVWEKVRDTYTTAVLQVGQVCEKVE